MKTRTATPATPMVARRSGTPAAYPPTTTATINSRPGMASPGKTAAAMIAASTTIAQPPARLIPIGVRLVS
ncbi:hypothetical protein ACWDV4_02220 [Micromonospora sp. NPDC003197]